MNEIIVYDTNEGIIPHDDMQRLKAFALTANSYVAYNAFTSYQGKKSANTNRRHRAELETLREFVQTSGATLPENIFFTNPESWEIITSGIVESFMQWLLKNGYEVRTINVRLSTIKVYAQLAFKAGTIDNIQRLMIKDIKGFTARERANINDKRDKTRIGNKKESPTTLRKMQVLTLKDVAGKKPSDLRDAVLMHIFLNHGLRVSEVELLKVNCIDIDKGLMYFVRPKMRGHIQETAVHKLQAETIQLLKEYLQAIPNPTPDSPLIRGSLKSGTLLESGMSTRAINKRVAELGNRLGVDHLSPHDLRHDVITDASQHNDVIDVKNLGGWTNLNRVLDYVNAQEIDNEGIKLSR